jgi:hypothetical protein
MIDVIRKSFSFQLDNLGQYLQVNYHRESPESGFAHYVFHQTNSQIPFEVANDADIDSLDSNRLSHAPVLATVGYGLACGRRFSESFLESWANGLVRLSGREAFPIDRTSFFYRPTELLGIAVGINYCYKHQPEYSRWLQDILVEGEQRIQRIHSNFWTFLISAYAAQLVSVTWKPIILPLAKDMTVYELALVKWFCSVSPIFADAFKLTQIEPSIDKKLLEDCMTCSNPPQDSVRAALLYFSLKTTIIQIINSSLDNYERILQSPKKAVEWLNSACDNIHTVTQQLQSQLSQPSDIEAPNMGDMQMLLAALSRLRSDTDTIEDQIIKLQSSVEIINEPNTMNYYDFQLLVTSDCKIRASSEQGEALGKLQLEMNKIRLALELIERGQTDTELLKSLGSELYQALFPAKIHSHFRATLAGAEENKYNVRLRLVFESSELAALPWEFLYDEDTNFFLANNTQTALSRYIDIPQKKRELKAASLPLKVLLVISSPTNLTPLDVAGEENLIREALAQHIDAGKIELDVLPEATIRNINQKLRQKPYNVFHFIGHGIFENDKGFIALVDQDNKSKLLDDEGFANFFLGNSKLGLAVLNSCQGAAVSSHQVFAGIAPNLVRRGIPAIIAMQYSILDSTAKLFADEFYRTLALDWPLDAAIQSTRNAISIEVGLDKRDFATPVLYMRAKDGIIMSGLH